MKVAAFVTFYYIRLSMKMKLTLASHLLTSILALAHFQFTSIQVHPFAAEDCTVGHLSYRYVLYRTTKREA